MSILIIAGCSRSKYFFDSDTVIANNVCFSERTITGKQYNIMNNSIQFNFMPKHFLRRNKTIVSETYRKTSWLVMILWLPVEVDGPNRLWIYPSLGIISWTFNVKSHRRRLFDAVFNQSLARAPVRDTAKFQKFRV